MGQTTLSLLAWARGSLGAGVGTSDRSGPMLNGGGALSGGGDVVLGEPWGSGAEYHASTWNLGLLLS